MSQAVLFSYPRSGTHFLLRLMKDWFYPHAELSGTLDSHEAIPYEIDGEEHALCPWIGLFGGHYYSPISDGAKEAMEGKHPIYLVRDGRDVMVSIWKMDMRVSRYLGEKEISFSRYIRENRHHVDQFASDNMIPYVDDGIPLPSLWWWSITQWCHFDDAYLVSYETLVEDPDLVRLRLSYYLGIDPVSQEVNDSPVGFLASSVRNIGTWKEHFTREDLEYWEECRLFAKGLPYAP